MQSISCRHIQLTRRGYRFFGLQGCALSADTLEFYRREENFCRNPTPGRQTGPWCFLEQGGWDYCDVDRGAGERCAVTAATHTSLECFERPGPALFVLTMEGRGIVYQQFWCQSSVGEFACCRVSQVLLQKHGWLAPY